jgi:hypothetical protein
MQCKKCGTAISYAIIAESVKKIWTICLGVGMTQEAAQYVVTLRGPLCRKCLKNWGSSDDDLAGEQPF